jgi:hypothetical protein
MKKNYSFKTAFMAVIMMVAFVSVSAQTTSVATIADLRAAGASLAIGATSTTTYTLTGEAVLTFISIAPTGTYAGTKTLYIQDASGAFMVYDSGKLITNTYNLYDGITNLTGTIKNYYGSYELILTVAPAVATSTGHTPYAPIVTTIDHLIDYPLQLAKINNVTISDQATGGTGFFVAGKNFPLSVGGVPSTTVYLRTSYADVNYIGAAVPTTTPQNITGLVLPYQYNATSALTVDFIPRLSSDITPSSTAGFSTPKADVLSLSLTGRNLTVNNVVNGTNVDIYSAIGSRVQSAQLQGGAVQLTNLAKGMYIVRVGNLSSKIML